MARLHDNGLHYGDDFKKPQNFLWYKAPSFIFKVLDTCQDKLVWHKDCSKYHHLGEMKTLYTFEKSEKLFSQNGYIWISVNVATNPAQLGFEY